MAASQDMLRRQRKLWTKAEIADLYHYASLYTQGEAAELLGRSRMAINQKVRDLGIVWGQGTWNSEQIAKIIGCTPPTAMRAIRILFHNVRGVVTGSDKAPRCKLNDEQAERVINVLRQTRQHRAFHVKGGQARQAQLKKQRQASAQQ